MADTIGTVRYRPQYALLYKVEKRTEQGFAVVVVLGFVTRRRRKRHVMPTANLTFRVFITRHQTTPLEPFVA
eukprot:CAMPEP_0117623884 /NCGR_PEP_ID=MMETSP0802-20121206/65_1 /TAXON_ID=38833 /ORGANISM="Micromonas sp., Strain CCMP2099" /LENGTH=71 /DNA_ID=CAMNT_0005427847 /DNA_START=217 /DNA_END=432 /DNA_ORIENTATION=+